jgi:DNA modification methylase
MKVVIKETGNIVDVDKKDVMFDHKVMCGSSTDEIDVQRLINNNQIIACITDPPYSVNYQDIRRRKDSPTRKERGDVYLDPPAEEVLKFIGLLQTDVLVMSYPVNKHFHLLSDMTKDWNLLYDCVWVKHHFAFIMGRNYQPQHEPILIFRKKKFKNSVFNVPNNQSTVFNHDKPAANKDHPTIKPTALYVDLVKYHSNKEDFIFEPFGGSGTTLLACEQTKRRCLVMELQPEYCEITIKRWEDLTGKKRIKV